VAQLSAC